MARAKRARPKNNLEEPASTTLTAPLDCETLGETVLAVIWKAEHLDPDIQVEWVSVNTEMASVSSRSGSSDTTSNGSTEPHLALQHLQRSRDETKAQSGSEHQKLREGTLRRICVKHELQVVTTSLENVMNKAHFSGCHQCDLTYIVHCNSIKNTLEEAVQW